jgi:hypothetical protein
LTQQALGTRTAQNRHSKYTLENLLDSHFDRLKKLQITLDAKNVVIAAHNASPSLAVISRADIAEARGVTPPTGGSRLNLPEPRLRTSAKARRPLRLPIMYAESVELT